jgi:pimeloyl-ACP methyl ester carboxylesterase
MSVTTVSTNGLDLAYEQFGEPGGRPLLLIMGLGGQMVAWDDRFCRLFVDRGFHVTRFDNRDIGCSTHLTGSPDLAAALRGDRTQAPYLVSDMADDTAGLLDGLGLDSAHVVGISMGGMIAQALAIAHPGRVRSLTSIMSTPDPALSPPTRQASAALLHPPPTTRDEAVTMALADWRVIGSPGFPFEEARIRRVAEVSWDRDHDPAGRLRQLVAILCSPSRVADLGRVGVPTLVIHGEEDPLVTPPGGEATARAVPGATYLTYAGMGHQIPEPLWVEVVDRITALSEEAEARA